MKKLLLVFAMVLAANVSFAGGASQGTVALIYPNGDYVMFRLNNDVCNSVTLNEYYKIDMVNQQPAADYWFSMLLAASATGATIKTMVADCNAVGHKNLLYLYQDI